MSTSPLINWLSLAVSLTNTILLVWLALTVLLNSDRRSWGIWLGGGGLLLGGAFFVSHTAILSSNLIEMRWSGFLFWWTAGLTPAIILPFFWYVVMLWYAGYWDSRDSALKHRQQWWFLLVVILVTGGLLLFAVMVILLASPAPGLDPIRAFWNGLDRTLLPGVLMGYGIYVVLCITLSLDALIRPGPSHRVMGQFARVRAQPWLIATSGLLLLVSVLVAAVLLWFIGLFDVVRTTPAYLDMLDTVARIDLLIESTIGLGIVLLGQAVVAYEIFTGRTLPSQGLSRQWRITLVLALGMSLLISAMIVRESRPIYTAIVAVILLTVVSALSGWQAFSERERAMDSLRPFISSQDLYQHFLQSGPSASSGIRAPFVSLCRHVLDASLAYLVAVGSLAPFAGDPLGYPDPPQGISVGGLLPRITGPGRNSLPIDPNQYAGAIWAVPLWSQRGLIGMFLLGPKRGNAVYTQEEIDIARITGERLIDTQASAEMGRRLINLQRERMAHDQVLDQRTRRALHDEILPLLHTAMIALSQQDGVEQEVMHNLADAHRQISDLLRELPPTILPTVNRLGPFGALEKTLKLEWQHTFDEVDWQVDEACMEASRNLPTLSAEVLYFAAREVIRNAARHGRSQESDSPLHLRISCEAGDLLALTIEDNGVGIDAPTSASQNGTGHGLPLHSTLMAVVGGSLAIESVPGRYTRITLSIPTQTGEPNKVNTG